MASIYEFSANSITGEEISLERYKGKVLLIVNTASTCSLTPQYAGLEKLYKNLGPRGFEVLGFPCDQFGGQEPGNEADIKRFCAMRYAITFQMFAKGEVNGRKAHPLFKFLKRAKPGWLGFTSVKWNFTKFLVDRQGNVVERFSPRTKPAEIEAAIEALL